MEPTNFRDPARWNTIVVPDAVAQRARTNIDVDANGCWISRYSVASHGYAQIGWSVRGHPQGKKNRMVLAHRASWTAVNGQVPMGMTIDHLCKVRRCVNPDHLRLLPNYENSRRNKGHDWPIGTCSRGHSAESLIPIKRRSKSGEPRYGVTCGECARIHKQKWKEVNPEREQARRERSNAQQRARRAAASAEADS